MLDTTPPNIRFLAHSTRGYKGSSSFGADDATPDQIKSRLGHDLASIVTAYIDQLGLLSHSGSKLKLIFWSLGGGNIISAYNLLANNALSTTEADTLRTKVSEIILYENPSHLCFGASASVFTNAYRAAIAGKSYEEMFDISIKNVTGFYDYDNSTIANLKVGIRDDKTAYRPRRSATDDAGFMEFITPAIDPAPLPYYLQSITPESEEGVKYARDALKAMLESPGVRNVKVLTTRYTVPDCLEGAAIVVGELRTLEKGMGIEEDTKTELRLVDGEYNHFLHVQAPEVVWENVMG